MPISICENRDCMEAMGEFPDKYFELAVVDPPYGIGESRAQGENARGKFVIDKRSGKKTYLKRFHTPKDWDDRQPPQEYFNELFRVARRHLIFGENYETLVSGTVILAVEWLVLRWMYRNQVFIKI